jgi:hypothetical protein
LRAVLGDVRTPSLRNASQGWCAPKPGVPCYELRPSPRSALPKEVKRGAQLATRLAIPTSREMRLADHAPLRDPKAQSLAGASAGRFCLENRRPLRNPAGLSLSGCPVDLRSDREAASLVRWLREYLRVKLICHD